MRRAFIPNATDRIQAILTIITFVIPLAVMFIVRILNLNIFYSVVLILSVALSAYLFIGKLLARTRRTLKSQGRFLSNVVHELNDTMAVMQLNSEFSLRAADPKYRLGLSKRKSQELIDSLKSDLSGLKNMSNIIKNLSIMASYEYKQGQIKLSRVNLSSLLKRLCDAVSKQLADKKDININIDIDVDTKLPVYIMGNETALEQMITNLLNNAVKYSSAGGGVNASISTTPYEVIMSVKDNGIGMSEEDMSRMFMPFHRSSSSEVRKEEGSGLGLAIVKEVAREHKAKIFVRSILKEGTEVSVCFPATA